MESNTYELPSDNSGSPGRISDPTDGVPRRRFLQMLGLAWVKLGSLQLSDTFQRQESLSHVDMITAVNAHFKNLLNFHPDQYVHDILVYPHETPIIQTNPLSLTEQGLKGILNQSTIWSDMGFQYTQFSFQYGKNPIFVIDYDGRGFNTKGSGITGTRIGPGLISGQNNDDFICREVENLYKGDLEVIRSQTSVELMGLAGNLDLDRVFIEEIKLHAIRALYNEVLITVKNNEPDGVIQWLNNGFFKRKLEMLNKFWESIQESDDLFIKVTSTNNLKDEYDVDVEIRRIDSSSGVIISNRFPNYTYGNLDITPRWPNDSLGLIEAKRDILAAYLDNER